MDLILGYLAGLLTLINPCVLPVLPIVLAGSLQTDPRAPVALAAGMGLSFVAVGTGVAAIGPALGIYPEDVTRIAALVMVGFGLVMVLPVLARRFSLASAGIAAAADARIAATPRGIGAEFAGGALLGAVWSPCIGPTLGAAIAFMTWIWLSATVVLAGAQLNAELEMQTARDTTTGPERPMGARGAEPADTVAA